MGESSPINKSLAGNVEKKNSTEDSMLLDAVLGDLKKEFSSTTNPKTSTPQQPIKQTSTPLATTKSLIERLQEAHKLYAQHNKTDRDDRIIGIDALTSYVKWTRLAQKTLQQNPTKEELEQISAHLPQRLTQKKRIPTLDPKKTKTGSNQPKSISFLQKRLDRIEERIKTLNESKPEYIEERVSLENKRSLIERENLSAAEETSSDLAAQEKAKQLQEVEALLNKKSFGYVAPVISPVTEERKRLQKAKQAAEIDAPVAINNTAQKTEKVNEDVGVSDQQLREASWLRESFVKKLQNTDKVLWYKKPSQNRDFVNEQLIKMASILGGKEPSHVDMDDIQTARLFMFRGAPKEILKHPAFAYVESFYNYQNTQGHSGKTTKEISETTSVKSPYVTGKRAKDAESAAV